ncbi:tetratricopeptide repeat protein [Nocardia concava]|uniref:tetratricopeptide repeat protein n=1 Tax=Nocardia concava TaxID=257281 RepID=UPI000316DF5A|nr:tetratricopeptide repeat protein [Nocardia concava]
MVSSMIVRQAEREPELMRDALKLSRWLADAVPRLDVDLARMLRSSARSRKSAGELEPALADVEESMRICRRGLTTGRVRYRVGLAQSLYLRADLLYELGRYAEATTDAREAVELCRTGIDAKPRWFGPLLLAALDTLARAHDQAGDPQQALSAGAEEVRILRRLVPHRPTYHSSLAVALHMLGVYADHAGDTAEALRATDEAIRLYQDLDELEPGAFTPRMDVAISNRELQLDKLQRAGQVVLGPYPLCARCEPVNGGLIAVRHRQQHIQVGEREGCIDVEIADILAALWERDCDTTCSCEDADGRAGVIPAAGQARLALEILADLGIHAELADEVVYFQRPAQPPRPASGGSRARIAVGRLLAAIPRH